MIRGIKLKEPTTFFSEYVELDLFYDEQLDESKRGKKQYSLIYGKNGSGKTSISKAFFSVQNEKNDYEEISFYDDDMNSVALDKDKVFVFNEQFIDENVKISADDSINAIVLFGKSKDLDEKIQSNIKLIEEEQKKIDGRHIEQYHEKKNACCIDDRRVSIIEQLKNGWASREQAIKGSSKKASVNEDTLNTYLAMNKPKKSQKELLAEYNGLLTKINNTRDKNVSLPTVCVSLSVRDADEYSSALKQSFDKKSMTVFSKKVLDLIQGNSSKYYIDSRDVLNNSDICPLCFQEISHEHKKIALDTLDEIFDKTIEEKKNELLLMIIEKVIEPDYSMYAGKIDSNSIEELSKAVQKINKEIDVVNAALNEKIGAIYDSHKPLSFNIKDDADKFTACVDTFNAKVQEYNKDVQNYEANKTLATQINKDLSYFDVESLITLHNKLKKDYDKTSKENEESRKAMKALSDENNKLLAQKNNYSIALEEMNSSLASIFGTTKRLKLKMSDDGLKYFIYSNGRKIKYNKLSTGEKNIIGLVYYYECLKKDCQQGDYFHDESLYIIDDPISSFDYENKIGILSFLKKIIGEIIKGNKDSQILIFTHELEVANYMNRIFTDLNISNKSCARELINKSTKRINPTKYTSYGKLLLEVYSYINDESIRNNISIGNTIRRLVEAYSFFNYNQEMDKFLAKDETYNKISDPQLKQYFKNRMNRILMNETSHSEDVIRQAPDTLNFDLFSDGEILQTAKDIICLLYCIDQVHINCYLSNEPAHTSLITTWISEIKALFAD